MIYLFFLLLLATTNSVSSFAAAGADNTKNTAAAPADDDDDSNSTGSQQQHLLLLEEMYAHARQVRTARGHRAALPLYRDILKKNPSDMTAATRLAAGPSTPVRQDEACSALGEDDNEKERKIHRLRSLLLSSHYDTQSIGSLFGLSSSQHRLYHAPSPIYLTPSAAGQATSLPFDPDKEDISPCQCLVALFLLGLSVPKTTVLEALSEENLELLQSLGLVHGCETDPNLIVAAVQIFPVRLGGGGSDDDAEEEEEGKQQQQQRQCNNDAWFATDWHPRVLSSTTVGSSKSDEEEENNGNAVMYIGPDSLALVQHCLGSSFLDGKAEDSVNNKDSDKSEGSNPVRYLLDICTGSGIQAIAALLSGKATRAVCVDINERALRFTYFNSILNGLKDRVVLVRGDILANRGNCIWNPCQNNTEIYAKADNRSGNEVSHNDDDGLGPSVLAALLQNITSGCGGYSLITANPPFLPVPPKILEARHGLFSSGGATGEAVLAETVALAGDLLVEGGILALVSEFFWKTESANDLMDRLELWYGRSNSATPGRVLLLTNQYPISVSTYAERRGDGAEEALVWEKHLVSLSITASSPGLLYLQKTASQHQETVSRPALLLSPAEHIRVPKSSWGSIWTPSNPDAVRFTIEKARNFFTTSNN